MIRDSVKLMRLDTLKTEGTRGVWIVNGLIFGFTLEPADNENQSNISNIPTGQYLCEVVNSSKYGRVYEIKNVTDRSSVLIHWGNLLKDTLGCVILGSEVGMLDGKRAILESKDKYNEFMLEMAERPFILTITENY